MPNKRFHPLFQMGLVFFLVAIALKWFLHPHTTAGQDMADGAMGLFFGLAIGSMLFGIWKSRQRPSGGSAPPSQG